MDDAQWPAELLFLRVLVRKYVPTDPRSISARLEAATQPEWDELNAGTMRLLQPENLARYQRLMELLADHDRDEHARILALVDGVMPIRGAGASDPHRD